MREGIRKIVFCISKRSFPIVFGRKRIMRPKTLRPLFVFLFGCFMCGSAPAAQSMDREHPTLLESPEVSGISNAIGEGYWYRLAAGPGELKVEMEVQCWNRYQCISSAQFVLYDAGMKEVMNKSLSTGSRTTVRTENVSVKFKERQELLLYITNGTRISLSAYGTYIIRFKGAIDLPGKEE
jgi:hypothetical protein